MSSKRRKCMHHYRDKIEEQHFSVFTVILIYSSYQRFFFKRLLLCKVGACFRNLKTGHKVYLLLESYQTKIKQDFGHRI